MAMAEEVVDAALRIENIEVVYHHTIQVLRGLSLHVPKGAMVALLGCDFSSSPTRRKPIVLAWGRCQGARVHLERLQLCETLGDWGQVMAQDSDWVGGFDLPFGLPRALVEQLNWPLTWRACMDHYASLDRAQIRKFTG